MQLLTFNFWSKSENYDYAMSWLSVDWRDNLWVTSSCDSDGGGDSGDGDGGDGDVGDGDGGDGDGDGNDHLCNIWFGY